MGAFMSFSQKEKANLWLLLFLLSLGFPGCAVGPDYQRPAAPVPKKWKWQPGSLSSKNGPGANQGKWKVATPQDGIAKGTWWRVFRDPQLDALESEATLQNQSLLAAAHRVLVARAQALSVLSSLFPNLDLNSSFVRERVSPNQPFFPKGRFSPYANDFRAALDTLYELDVWGRIRRSFEAAQALAQASQADYETVLLTLHADVANNYYTLRAIDAQILALQGTLEAVKRNLELVRARFQGGLANELDLARAQTEKETVESQLIGLKVTRAQLENAIALDLGRPASSFQLPFHPLEMDKDPPPVPAYLPSELLERRPDVAGAERRMAASNAQIGVATAAFFPTIRLTGSGGFESVQLSNLFSWSSRMWAIGPSLYFPLFEGGRLAANLEAARAAYEASVNDYRQQVLQAFREVEDALSSIRILGQQMVVQRRAVEAARKQYDVSLTRFKEGLVDYFEVDDSERTWTSAQLVEAQIAGQRYVSTVTLIKALGGGWLESTRPSQE
ncbi:efflux transporter outer membrane subunit [Candidatus Methylacidithermus pantelleriae]|uniref:Outer membrane component of tripartite multidrug resistance system n=1 Tax=Candidatus Methylacidithermus pantelleriae TaxID=2744239 RepID=A0A8J2BSU8_9BACT|nr:efflux transporter outer membrane subunit [Candidatus Methylacidithermus pantelleriae]CAF0696094.1 Outer membrane component of tripartite multidrug resistance system [Candidatus Methylacidithermus pantelleriae]